MFFIILLFDRSVGYMGFWGEAFQYNNFCYGTKAVSGMLSPLHFNTRSDLSKKSNVKNLPLLPVPKSPCPQVPKSPSPQVPPHPQLCKQPTPAPCPQVSLSPSPPTPHTPHLCFS
ncbi:MAG: hypothetical protein F6J93_32765 [Oscillatoria sp. SIO1A7]|nr:hypothetical protein [Oscillatoria sp. SIO1A7]